MNTKKTDTVSTKEVEKTNVKVKEKIVEKISDTDEVEIISLIPNVSYEDKRTGEEYEWSEVDDIQVMKFESVKHMMRNHKGYFKNLVLKPVDERVIEQLGLSGIYSKYKLVLNKDSYTKNNIDNICDEIINMPNSIKSTIFNKIQDMVKNGVVSDINVIRTLERKLGLVLVSLF